MGTIDFSPTVGIEAKEQLGLASSMHNIGIYYYITEHDYKKTESSSKKERRREDIKITNKSQ